MRLILTILFVQLFTISAFAAPLDSQRSPEESCPSWLDHDVKRLHSDETINLCDVSLDKPLLIINTASHCGFTPQFKELEALYQAHKDKGLVVLGFASNSFKQEAKEEEKIASICYINYGVTFTMFSPVEVKGENAHPVFAHLAEQARAPSWNFNKYLVARDGRVKHYGSGEIPGDEEVLAAF